MRILIATVLLAVASIAYAGEATVRAMMAGKIGSGRSVSAVRKLPFADLYEVAVQGGGGAEIYYVDGDASVIIAGQILDARTGRNLTEERLRKLSAISWEGLPFDSAITTVRGNGRRKIAVFSDPNCPYCQRFEKTLASIDDVTVHIFLYPVIKPESMALTKAVWCSRDRAGAWHALMLRGVRPSATPDCATPVEKLVALGHRLGATSTPTWFVQTGERYSSAMRREKLVKLLDEVSR